MREVYEVMDEGVLYVPEMSKWSDDQLGRLTSAEFAQLLHERAVAIAEDLYSSAAYKLVGLEPQLYRERLIFYQRRRAWAEWYFGTVTPARQIALLPDTEIDLKLRLARQIRDEVRHYDAFTGQVRRQGGEARLKLFPAPTALLEMHDVQLVSESAAELAAANQYSGEIVLAVHARQDGNVLASLLDPETMAVIVDIERDEPAHIAIGRDLVRKYALEPGHRRRIAEAQERFLRGLCKQHCWEIESLGAERVRPLPSFSS
jgi:hypothetical protein